jgi:hypothetical protein
VFVTGITEMKKDETFYEVISLLHDGILNYSHLAHEYVKNYYHTTMFDESIYRKLTTNALCLYDFKEHLKKQVEE